VLRSERGHTGTAAADDRPAAPRGGWRTARGRLLWSAAVVLAGVLLCWLYLLESRTQAANSDSAAMVLQGREMLHGNPLLRGWFLSDVSFYTFEVPLDGLVAAVRGYNTDAVHVAAALVYTLLVLLSALLAKGRARGREGVVRALLAAGILLAPAISPGAHVLLLAPDHTGIGVPVLLTLLVVDRAPQRWWLPAAACVLLTWAQVDDPVASLACAAPLAVVCAVRAVAVAGVRYGRRRAGRPDVPAWPWYDAALAVAAVASYGLTRLTLSAIRSAGGFYVHGVIGGTGLAPWSHIPRQLLWTGQNVLDLFGANYFSLPRLAAEFGYLHLAGVAVALCGFLIGTWGLFFRVFHGRADRVTQTITAGVLVTLAAGAFGTHMAPVQGAHEIAIVLPFGAVLGGRLAGPWLAGTGRAGRTPRAPRAARAGRLSVASLLALAGIGYAAVLGYNASRPAAPAETQTLAGWLAGHQLTRGLGGYWQADITTLATGGKVQVAPLEAGGTSAYPWESKAGWYDPAVSSANFVVVVSSPASAVYARPQAVRAWYGRPAHTYRFGQYTIMVYNYNLLLRVRQPVAGRL
jgi:hypothetical protein